HCRLPCLERQAIRHAMQPTRDRIALPNFSRHPGEQQERRLKDVLGVVEVTLYTAADLENHWPVPLDERHERRLVPMRDESLEELAITHVYRRGGVDQLA